MKLYKRYVEVITLIGKEGQIKPLYMIWETYEGKTLYKIDKITQVRQSQSQVGGCGILYECHIDGKVRHLFYERDRWFLESHKP